MAEEKRLHVEHLTQKRIADGLSPEEARFAAQRRSVEPSNSRNSND
jgi:hypothetical protein